MGLGEKYLQTFINTMDSSSLLWKCRPTFEIVLLGQVVII